MEHMVHSPVLPGALHGHHVLGVGHHAHQGMVPLGGGAQGALPLPVGEVLAHRAAADALFRVQQGGGEVPGGLLGLVQDVKSQPLGALAAHAGQLGELLH